MNDTPENFPESQVPENTYKHLAKQLVSALISRGIKVIALDFDKTLITLHTGGAWRQGHARLAEFVRPCFRWLLPAALDGGLHVCIVTYSMQLTLIYEVLKAALPKCDYNKIIIRGNSKDWAQVQGATLLGKQQHIASVITEISNKRHAIVHPNELLLLDDDIDNIEVAKRFGHKTFEVGRDVSLETLLDVFKSNVQL
ncbi:PREDICTED: uncharacterized protein LOC106804785 [Priapulus caudatus]|uniref:Uncharacterized protein LOC106804785 n=1 Tax=Priapulus caudatus TaxID=37621 RepID=A0ABM1DNU0_PRICU|nr:PREDICTED: uncharacterized protein LOC106804785 [Priapulus caudatus]XP_014661609.1 PREDICTED: uncharacterized protein LOC106804785 [Priapulus caudatus]XP_014661610.1 PREDICTED: uncharacterized protein LOC106804785 [Priapulus caudatus]XP_014661611.1 PREDICTED: uncharacterized protein LOC106804785 [Priapulus caudatus]